MQNFILAMPMEVHKRNKHEKQEVGLPISMFFLPPSLDPMSLLDPMSRLQEHFCEVCYYG